MERPGGGVMGYCPVRFCTFVTPVVTFFPPLTDKVGETKARELVKAAQATVETHLQTHKPAELASVIREERTSHVFVMDEAEWDG